MFFAPPQVKSLSRYSEFGIYLQQKHFLMMLGLAILIHAVVLGIYAMAPREEVIQIPVRALNIKLGDGGGNVVQMPASMPVTQPAPTPVQEAPASAKATQLVTGKVYSGHMGHSHHLRARHIEDASHTSAAEGTLAQPKRYVREGNLAEEETRKGKGNGRSIAGTPEGDEIIQRYEQTISLWFEQHKIYPEIAKQQGIEGSAIVRIRIDRAGRILDSSIDHSSGNKIIDDAALAMVRSSNPVPVVPENYPDGEQFEYLIPVSFQLQ